MSLPPHLAKQIDVLLIDNFDSFTWNLYQQLRLLGAKVTVIRNDAIQERLIPHLKIKSLIISPGPGHPQTDSGISKAAIKYFQGKVPVMGVCMGLECLVDLHGGEIGYAGEIMHGKVSKIRHDNRGSFRGVPQAIQSTRYHSLSASQSTLPADLAITAVSDTGVIMAVRHRDYTLEAVQYHPESVLSEGGDVLFRNFLALRGGSWKENPESLVLDESLPSFELDIPSTSSTSSHQSKIPSILDKIYKQRLSDVSLAQSTAGTTFSDLQTMYSLNIAPPLISFVDRLKQRSAGHPSLLAEIKRASPSKGPIAVSKSAPLQALRYATAGAHAISVLTEPKWFLGSLQDMLQVRTSVGNLSNRPAILRKDFILSRYQVLESRIWGADTVLLIVSMLSPAVLRDLYHYSLELGMEPLVEVNNAKEMELALSLPAKVIGVNNRNLHDFQVDLGTTSRLSEMVKGKDVLLCALSGISTPQDVQKFHSDGASAVLIGESLMRADDPAVFIRQLFSMPPLSQEVAWRNHSPLIKICGIRSPEEAIAVANLGADMLGLMFVPNSKRYIDIETGKAISASIRQLRYTSAKQLSQPIFGSIPWFNLHATRFGLSSARPLLVGVFQNQALEDILSTVSYCQLDMVQLHGSEPFEWAKQIPVPVIRAFHGQKANTDITRGGGHQFILLDSMRDDDSGLSGGSGKTADWGAARKLVDQGEVPDTPDNTVVDPQSSESNVSAATTSSPDDIVGSRYPLPVILAGGLTPENITSAIAQVQPWAVDVSGGVETEDGVSKDLVKVEAFITSAKAHAN